MNVFIFAVYLFASIAMAQVPTPKADQYTRFKTAIVNGGFENGPTPGWATSGGAFSVSTTSGNFRSGLRGGVFNSSAASQTLTSSANTLSAGNNQVSCWFKTTATDYKFQAWDGTNVLAEQTIPALSEFTKLVLNVGMSSPAALRARVISASDAADLIVDDCMSGEADNVGTVSQASFVGSAVHPATTNCAWTTTSTSYGNFSVDSDCPTPTIAGSALAPSTKIPGIRFSSLPPGEYLVMAKAAFRDITLDTNGCGFALHDGTTRAGQNQIYAGTNMGSVIGHLSSRFKYTTAQGDTTFQVQAQSDNAANTCALGLADTGSAQVLEFLVYRFPLDSEMAFNPNTIASSWSGYHDSTCSWARTNTALGDPTADATCTLTERTNRNFGTVVSYDSGGNKLPGIVFTPVRAGKYLVCANFAVADSVASVSMAADLSDLTPTVIGSAEQNSDVVGNRQAMSICGQYVASDVSAKTIRIRTRSVGSGTITIESGQNAIEWSILSIDQAIPAPLLVGNVTSNSLNAERVERAKVLCSSSSSITSQSGSWVSSIGNIATGTCTLTLATGAFSATPTCVMNVSANNGTVTMGAQVSVSSATSVQITGAYNTGGTTVTSTTFSGELLCMGPK